MRLRHLHIPQGHKRPFLVAALLIVAAQAGHAQFFGGNFIGRGTAMPTACKVADVYFKTSAPIGLYACLETNTWGPVGTGIGLTTRIACSAAQRGRFWVTAAPSGQADAVEVCAKQADDTYAWLNLLAGGSANLTWSALTSGQWAAMTASQWLTMLN